jgi:DNA-binding MurR/RpiR family transcriptional regulator
VTLPFDSIDAFLGAVAARYAGLPRQLKAVARHVEANRDRMLAARITEVARACGVHASAVTRFSQRLGFSGYVELQALFRDAFRAGEAAYHSSGRRRQTGSDRRRRASGDIVRQLLVDTREAIAELGQLDDRALGAALTALSAAEQIYVVGVRDCLAAATYLTYMLQHTSKTVRLVTGTGGTFASELRNIRERDLLVAITFTPDALEVRTCVRIAAARGAAILAIADTGLGAVSRRATVKLLVNEPRPWAVRSLASTMCLLQGLSIALTVRLESGHPGSPHAPRTPRPAPQLEDPSSVLV